MSNPPYIRDVTEADFDTLVVERSVAVPQLVDFWAPWCGPCRTLMPLLDAIVTSLDGAVELAKVNSDENQELAARFAVRSLPTVKLFRNRAVVDEFMGAQPESSIRSMLDKHVPRASDALREQAHRRAQEGDLSGALEPLERALAQDPGNTRIHPDLALVYLELGRPLDALETLDAMPLPQRAEDPIQALRARARLAAQASDGGRDLETLRQAVAAMPGDTACRFQLSTALAAAEDYEAALDQLLQVLRQDRRFADGAARKAMLDIFALLGNGGPVVSRYRGLLARALN